MNNSHFLALWRGVEESDPLDTAPRLILADWLADHGHEPDLERGLRWAAEHEWWPLVKPGGNVATNLSSARESMEIPVWNRLVVTVCNVGAKGMANYCGCSAPSVMCAVRYVGIALRLLRERAGAGIIS